MLDTAKALTGAQIADADRKISTLYDMLDEQDATNRDAKGLPFTVRTVMLLRGGAAVLTACADPDGLHHRPQEDDSSHALVPCVDRPQLRRDHPVSALRYQTARGGSHRVLVSSIVSDLRASRGPSRGMCGADRPLQRSSSVTSTE